MASASELAGPSTAAAHRPPPHTPWWTEGHWLCGGETWRVVAVSDQAAADALCIAVDQNLDPAPFECHRIEPLGKNHQNAQLVPHPQSRWAKKNKKIVLDNVPRKGPGANDPRQLYRGQLITDDGQPREFFILEGRDGTQDDTATLRLSNPDEPGTNGGTASYRR